MNRVASIIVLHLLARARRLQFQPSEGTSSYSHPSSYDLGRNTAYEYPTAHSQILLGVSKLEEMLRRNPSSLADAQSTLLVVRSVLSDWLPKCVIKKQHTDVIRISAF